MQMPRRQSEEAAAKRRANPLVFAFAFALIAAVTLAIVLPTIVFRGQGQVSPDLFGQAPAITTPERAVTESSRQFPGKGVAAPDFAGITGWVNTEPLSLAQLRGKVVLVDFWTYSCVNCIRTLKYLQEWHNKYKDKGLVIVGVHSPEFEFEKKPENVSRSVQEEGIQYAVALDNDFKTWQAFDNQYWPHKFLIDKDGYVRYDNIGEGKYRETDSWIQKVLLEAGYDVTGIPLSQDPQEASRSAFTQMTPETYLGITGLLRGSYTPGSGFSLDAANLYKDSGERRLHTVYFEGLWYNSNEFVRHGQATQGLEDYLLLVYRAKTVNLVMSNESGQPYRVYLWLDDKPMDASNRGLDVRVDEEGRSYVDVEMSRMYSLVNATDFGTHELKIISNSDALTMHAFTFGAIGVP
ncbi:MAG: redoxin domain-containing protein [Chloroflexi bacterium]|nr:redoxin domain-containing protein [Chloroflexota bacterium]